MIRKPLRHDRDRRRLDPSQVPQPTPITATVTTTGAENVSVAFDQPVAINGTLEVLVDGVAAHGQVIVDPTHITLVAAAAVAGKDWTIAANQPAVRNTTGGFVAPAAGTF